MAKETLSEKLVRAACAKYLASGIAKIKKNDPYIRIIKDDNKQSKMIYSGSSGLDFSGVMKGGQHISFEVKETENLALPIDSISTIQIDTIERELMFNADVFLLVMFKQKNQWYRLEHDYIKKVMNDNDCGYASIPILYFRAFGMLVPNDDETPDFLRPEYHPARKTLAATYPTWMAGHERKQRAVQTLHPYRSEEERRLRIAKAVGIGIDNAKKKERKIEIYKQRGSYEPQRRDPWKN